MPNLKNIISQHNKSAEKQNEPPQPQQPNCNCRRPNECPLDNQCLTHGIVYEATVTREDNNKKETYIGLTADQFKTRYNNHRSSFRHEPQRTDTSLSKYIWKLKDKQIKFNIRWKIVARSKAYSPGSRSCNLCLREKYYIICKPEMSTLNNRNELATECRHKTKNLLS